MAALRALYSRLPEEVRRCTRPLNLVDEAASLLPDAARERLVSATEAARQLLTLRLRRFPVRRLAGVGIGGAPLSCVLGMDDLATRYWCRTLFAGVPREERVGEVSASGIVRAAADFRGEFDLALWQAPWPIGRLGRPHVRVPGLVTLWLPTDRPLEEVFAGDVPGQEQRREEIRRVQRLGLATRLTRDADAYERFRRALYEPYVRARFGDLAEPLPPHAFRHARRNGWLLLAERDGRPVAGALLEHWGETLRLRALGAEMDGPVRPAAAIATCYYHVIRTAVERGFARLSFGTCRPVLSDGVLHYKRKWGGRLGPPLGRDGFLLRYRNTPGLRAALAVAPLILDLGHGELAALGAVRDADAELPALTPRLQAPGLASAACLVDRLPRRAPVAIELVPPHVVWPPGVAA